MKRTYEFILTPEYVEDVTDYLVVDLPDDEAHDVNAEIEADPEGYFAELDNGRNPGYVLESWLEILNDDLPEGARPYTLS